MAFYSERPNATQIVVEGVGGRREPLGMRVNAPDGSGRGSVSIVLGGDDGRA